MRVYNPTLTELAQQIATLDIEISRMRSRLDETVARRQSLYECVALTQEGAIVPGWVDFDPVTEVEGTPMEEIDIGLYAELDCDCPQDDCCCGTRVI